MLEVRGGDISWFVEAVGQITGLRVAFGNHKGTESLVAPVPMNKRKNVASKIIKVYFYPKIVREVDFASLSHSTLKK